MSQIRAIRGMTDILPDQTPLWQRLEASIAAILGAYGYSEIRMPIVEQTELFKRSIGEVTDIVEKEMYSFDDRNGESLTLRPEGTAGCVRAVNQHGLLNSTRRLWYSGPMFRYERPQKGRQRQFHQVGVETFGIATPDIDAELIILSARLWRKLGFLDRLELQLNSIGNNESRGAFRSALVEYLSARVEQLDEDSQRRLQSNPLRILDSKNADTQRLLDDAPVLQDYLDEESLAHFARLQELLSAAGVAYTVNPRLVRGLDYYNKTVFEWVTTTLGAQGTICAGGRYDSLVKQLGGKDTPAVGFALGMERLVLMAQATGDSEALRADVYFVAAGERAEVVALQQAERLRDALPGATVVVNCGGGSFKSQFKKADKSGAWVAVVLGDDEVDQGVAQLKALRADVAPNQQRQVALEDLTAAVQDLLRDQ